MAKSKARNVNKDISGYGHVTGTCYSPMAILNLCPFPT